MIYVCWGPAFLEPNLVRFDLPPILQVFYVNWLRHILITFLFFDIIITFSYQISGYYQLPIQPFHSFRKMYLPSIRSISGIVHTISSTSSSLITDLQAVLLMALAISLMLAGTLKYSIARRTACLLTA